DGRLLASASWDLTVRLWDVSTALNAGVASGNELASLTGHSGWVTSVAFSPDGTMLASGSGDQMRLWRIQETAAMPEPTPAAVLPVIPIATPLPLSPSAISPENAQRLTTQQTLETDGVKRIAWSPDGELLAVATYHIRLYDGATLAPEYVIDSVQWVYSLAFSPDGSLLAAPTIDGIKLWDTTGWGELQTLAGSKDTADLAFSPDGATLATATGNTVKLWDVSTALNAGVASGAELLTIPAGSSINAVAFSPDGRTVASGGQGDIRLWDVSTVLNAGAASGQEVHTLKGHTSWIKSLAFSPDGALLASGSVDGTVRLWDVAAGRQVRLLSGHTDQVEGVAFS
ncbi:MAG: WD40 repeat domain-containing protein, partial [Chloroflexota bacterium]